ncbi:pantoate--beta-alanine ligase [Corynebacterium pseudopelargi]|uniref:pantoate--beta-alanine ligase (AMP-forming) n=1 Tax=Corynebacterium pseudopelargi TaxID=2080757 RepID=A0A3G6IS57_9CORY|nr:pantoate--beta-alanine ligase [Corynebacterium pseudopelargi]AZA08455.1 Pantothenate synthetase [Corynebacterium pseudopelargi]
MFAFGQAKLFDETEIAMLGRAFAKQGRPVALVPLGADIHAGHVALIRAAKRLNRGVVVVVADKPNEIFAAEGVDAVLLSPELSTRTVLDIQGLEPDVAREVTRRIQLVNLVGPSDVFFGEKDFEALVRTQQALTDLRINVRVHSVPTVRMPDGVAVSLRNAQVAPEYRSQALALSAALLAGAHAAEDGPERVLEAARGVLDAAGVSPEYVELRSLSMGQAPDEGDARLLIAADFGGVRLIDSAGVPVGVGFRNLEA